MTKCKIVYGITDHTIAEDEKSYAFSSKTIYSKGEGIFNYGSKNRLAYLEKNYLLLDGSYQFPNSSETYDVGWESQNISDSTGAISEYIEMDFEDVHDCYGIILGLIGVSDFSVSFYKDTTKIASVSESGNTSEDYHKEVKALGWNRTIISVSKTSKPYQRARISSATLGISYEFDSDSLVSVDSTKAVSIKNDNTYSSEADISFYNEGLFDIKTIKDLPVGLQSGMNVSVYYNDILFNEYIVDKTEVEDDGKVIDLTCYDKLYYLNDSVFSIGKVYPEGRSLYDWAEEVASDGNVEISVDNSLKSIISKGYIGEVSHREALRLIAEAGNCNIKVESGSISIVPFATELGNDLGEDDILEDSLSIENEDKILGVRTNVYSFSKTKTLTGISETTDIALTGEEQEISVSYSSKPAIATQTTNSSNITIISAKYGSETAIIRFKGNNGETGWIDIVGYSYNVASSGVEKGYIDSHVKEIKNTLIADRTMAESVAEFQFVHSSSNYSYSFDTQIDLSDKLMSTIKATKYPIIVSSVEINLDSDTESMVLGGEDYGE